MKSYEVFLMPDAIEDLADIYHHIADTSGYPKVARAYIEKLHQKSRD